MSPTTLHPRHRMSSLLTTPFSMYLSTLLDGLSSRATILGASLCLLVSLLPYSTMAQKEPGAQGPFALTNATIVTTPSDTIDSGTVLIQDDSIAAVGRTVSVPNRAQTIDCEGLTVYPGLIDSGTQLGLEEIGAVSETIDHNEIGDLTSSMEALVAVNPNSVSIPVTRVHGITTVLTEPTDGLLPGVAALITLHGYTPQQMHEGNVELTKLDFPSTGRKGPSDDRSPETIKKETEKALDELDEQRRVVHGVDAGIVGPVQRALQLKVVGRVGKNTVETFPGHILHNFYTVSGQNRICELFCFLTRHFAFLYLNRKANHESSATLRQP